MHDPYHLSQWDSLIKETEKYPVENKKSYGFMYMSNKKQYTFDSRDFYEKFFTFMYNDKYYRYTSYIENDSELRPIPPSTVRGTTLYNVGVMSRNP